MKAIDQVTSALRAQIPGVQVERLQSELPHDDTGLWFVRDPQSDVEINLESHNGEFPFLIENSRNDTRVTTTDIEETISAVRWTFGRYRRQGSPAA